MHLRSVILSATLLLAPTIAMAQMPELAPPPPLSGLYVGAGAGVKWLQPEHLINPATGNAANGNLVAQTGFVALVASVTHCQTACGSNLKATTAATSGI